MATGKVVTVEFDTLERSYVKHALGVYRSQLVRSQAKEVVGSQVHALRGEEITMVDRLLAKVTV